PSAGCGPRRSAPPRSSRRAPPRSTRSAAPRAPAAWRRRPAPWSAARSSRTTTRPPVPDGIPRSATAVQVVGGRAGRGGGDGEDAHRPCPDMRRARTGDGTGPFGSTDRTSHTVRRARRPALPCAAVLLWCAVMRPAASRGLPGCRAQDLVPLGQGLLQALARPALHEHAPVGPRRLALLGLGQFPVAPESRGAAATAFPRQRHFGLGGKRHGEPVALGAGV